MLGDESAKKYDATAQKQDKSHGTPNETNRPDPPEGIWHKLFRVCKVAKALGVTGRTKAGALKTPLLESFLEHIYIDMCVQYHVIQYS